MAKSRVFKTMNEENQADKTPVPKYDMLPKWALLTDVFYDIEEFRSEQQDESLGRLQWT